MFLYERVIGVVTYTITLLLMCYYISKCNKKQVKKILFLYTIILSIMGFFFVPPSGADLYRLNIYMEDYSKIDISEIFTYISNTTTPLSVLYMCIIGKTGINGLLPAINTFIVYSNVFYILKKMIIKYEIKPKNIAYSLFILMSSGAYFEVISGIRTMLAFSIIARCIFEEFIENKSFIKNIIWYIVASLIHSAGVVIVIIRVLYLAIEKRKKANTKFLFYILAFVLIFGMLLFGGKYLDGMFNKATSYINADAGYSYIWEYIIGFIMLFILIEVQHFYKKYVRKDNYDIGIYNIYKFSCIINLIVILLCFEYNIFHRFIIFNSIIILPLLLNVITYVDNNIECKECKNFYNIIYTSAILILFIACARGNLSSLKFFEIK